MPAWLLRARVPLCEFVEALEAQLSEGVVDEALRRAAGAAEPMEEVDETEVTAGEPTEQEEVNPPPPPI